MLNLTGQRLLSIGGAFLLSLALTAGFLTLLNPVEASTGAVITVNTTADELNNNGNCSLREAVQTANTNAPVDNCTVGSGPDTIVIPVGVYVLSLAGFGEDGNATGDLDILEEVTLQGAFSGTTIIDGGGLDRVLHTVPTTSVTVTLAGLTIQNGRVSCSTPTCTTGAGGIHHASTGDLTIQDSIVRANSIFCSGANCGTYTNTAGILLENKVGLTIQDTIIEGNRATCSGTGCEAGAVVLHVINVTPPSGSLLVENTVIQNNGGSCSDEACRVGELFSYRSSDTAVLRQTVLASNTITCAGDNCDGDEVLELDDANYITVDRFTAQYNEARCTGGACDVDEMIALDGPNQAVTLTQTNLSYNLLSCVGEPITNTFDDLDHCDTDELLEIDGGITLTVQGLTVFSNTLSCMGDGCDTDELVSFDGPDETLLVSDTLISHNTQICSGGVYTRSSGFVRSCDTDELFEADLSMTVTVRSLQVLSNTLICNGFACDTDEMVSINSASLLLDVDGLVINDNQISCNGDSIPNEDYCDTDEVFEADRGTIKMVTNLTMVNNEVTCTGDTAVGVNQGCDIDELVSIEGGSELMLTHSQIVSNSQICNGDGCRISDVFEMGSSPMTATSVVVQGNLIECSGDGCVAGEVIEIFNGPNWLIDSVIQGNTTRCLGPNCDFVNNQVVRIASDPGLTTNISNTTVSDNQTTYIGGGIYVEPYSSLMLWASTVSSNTADLEGGGLFVLGSAELFNSTVSGNTAGFGGGIVVTGTLTMTHVTVNDNIALTQTGGISMTGVSTATVTNSLVANSTGADCAGSGTFTDGGYNLFEDGSCITAGSSQSGDPQLGPLADNGGDTETHSLPTGSPAVDAIPAGTSGCGTLVTIDQRGVARPQENGCDIGAFELRFYNQILPIIAR
ncbi:MAG: CSLREA domain-containing protein [Ardenticatenaceae bacterium]|nr:CSLREA domain-containing protein [Ardenticatenaceae bacterium]